MKKAVPILGRRVWPADGMLITMDQRDQMRAADSDREAVAERLRSALSEGRLDLHEYDERLQRAYAAKTYADLKGLLVDLPGAIPAQQAQVVPADPAGGSGSAFAPGSDLASGRRYPDATRKWLIETWDSYFGVVSVTLAIWAVICLMSWDLLYFWPGWVAGPWGVVLMVNTVRGLATGEPQKWAAKQARKEQAKIEKRARAAGEDERDDLA
jgi:hypothetical protein